MSIPTVVLFARRRGLAGGAACIVVLLLGGAALVAASQRPSGAVTPRLPPLLLSCPHHPDVVEDRPGTCPLCRMALVPVRIDSAWMCPVHAVVSEASRGECRLCGRALVQVAVSLSWRCRTDAREHLEPGLCADGTPRVMRRSLRPHGNHNPQHGGQFFMAPDSWHHLEGAYPRERVFRVYVYDDFARTLATQRMSEVHGRVVTRETYNPMTRTTTELATFPLTLARGGTYLEARIDTHALPAEMTAKMQFAKGGPEYRFDFTFTEVTKDPADAVVARPAARARRPAVAVTADATRPDASAERRPLDTAAAPEPVFDPTRLSMSEILTQMQKRSAQTGELVRRGDFGSVWIPAFATKELAVALEPHVAHLPSQVQLLAGPALRDVVRTAWQLDAIADAGDRPRIEEAYTRLADAVARALIGFDGGLQR